MRQIKAAGAARLASSCSNCRQTSDDGQARFRWDRKTESLFELVAENLGT
jgi:Fe-S oxidoreductase